jgi:hypothetical protein
MTVEQINSAGKALYLHHDQQGSTRMLTGSTGKSEATMTYLGAAVGAGVGCLAGAVGTVFSPVNPLQPSEGGP